MCYNISVTKTNFILTDNDFCTGNSSWVIDFAKYGMTEEYSRAYFRAFNLYPANMPYGHILTLEDVDQIINVSEIYVGKKRKTYICFLNVCGFIIGKIA